ncbi:uncharacterized protein LOC111038475 [Myzus persicae]|uniref:uncharacterized protein LOC111038475 n=1 Tax=Myzus persicae TaxID=13164 RepID=UPI000B936B00|nr:uncharacterized protein LOC111038475 [Myzus persicae]
MFDTEEFIVEVSNEEAIWNIESKLYHDKNAKHISWTKVAKKLFKDFEDYEETVKMSKIAELHKKWKSLRNSYRRKCITKSGQAATTSKPYIYANVLDFLRPTMQNRTTESNVKLVLTSLISHRHFPLRSTAYPVRWLSARCRQHYCRKPRYIRDLTNLVICEVLQNVLKLRCHIVRCRL